MPRGRSHYASINNTQGLVCWKWMRGICWNVTSDVTGSLFDFLHSDGLNAVSQAAGCGVWKQTKECLSAWLGGIGKGCWTLHCQDLGGTRWLLDSQEM